MVGSRFYVFGGQVDGEFLNDLWAFDLNTCEFSSIISLHLQYAQLRVSTK